jgi:hypothetical protein
MLYFFRSLIYFDWIEDHLISDRVGFGSCQISLIFKKNQIESNLNMDKSDEFLELDRILSPLVLANVSSWFREVLIQRFFFIYLD